MMEMVLGAGGERKTSSEAMNRNKDLECWAPRLWKYEMVSQDQ